MVKKRTRVFKPRPLNNNNIDEGIKRALTDAQKPQQPMSFKPQSQPSFNPNPQQQQQSTFHPPNVWGNKPITPQQTTNKPMSFNPQPQQSLQPQPMYQPPKFGQDEPVDEDEPFWDGAQWEEWALMMYDNYPDTHKYLPDWFVKAVQEMG